MTDIPNKVVIDCGDAAALAATVPQLLEEAAVAARAGDMETTNRLFELARARTAPDAQAVETIRPYTNDEITQLAADTAEQAQLQQQQVARAWVEMRMKRDRWLAQTDAFFVNPLPSDFPADKSAAISANAAAWRAFRQALRDLPANTTDPFNPAWPTPPAAPQVYLT